MTVTGTWEESTLAEQVLLLTIEQTRAFQQQRMEEVNQLGEEMIDVMKLAIYESAPLEMSETTDKPDEVVE